MVEREWRLACVLQLSPDEDRVKVTLLHPPGPSNSFRYPKSEHIVTVTVKDILTVVRRSSDQNRMCLYTFIERNESSYGEIFFSAMSSTSLQILL